MYQKLFTLFLSSTYFLHFSYSTIVTKLSYICDDAEYDMNDNFNFRLVAENINVTIAPISNVAPHGIELEVIDVFTDSFASCWYKNESTLEVHTYLNFTVKSKNNIKITMWWLLRFYGDSTGWYCENIDLHYIISMHNPIGKYEFFNQLPRKVNMFRSQNLYNGYSCSDSTFAMGNNILTLSDFRILPFSRPGQKVSGNWYRL